MESPSWTPICSTGAAERLQPAPLSHAGLLLSAILIPALSFTWKPTPGDSDLHAHRIARIERTTVRMRYLRQKDEINQPDRFLCPKD
jgi:hypothetical protein